VRVHQPSVAKEARRRLPAQLLEDRRKLLRQMETKAWRAAPRSGIHCSPMAQSKEMGDNSEEFAGAATQLKNIMKKRAGE
jgi:hypothetical protein